MPSETVLGSYGEAVGVRLCAWQAQERKSVRLFYGTHSPEMTPFMDIIPKWEAMGVQVLPVYSADGNGYVQDVFEQARLFVQA